MFWSVFCSAIEMYHDQIKWLSQGNRKVTWISEMSSWIWFKQMNFGTQCWFDLICQVFGVVNGSRVGVLVDTSDFNCSTERLADLQRELLVGPQMSHCFILYFANLINYTAHFVVFILTCSWYTIKDSHWGATALQKPTVSTVLRLRGQQPLGQTARYLPSTVSDVVCENIIYL